MDRVLFKEVVMFKNSIYDNALNCENYNLTYDFLNGVLGIDVVECYPTKYGFHILDDNEKSYMLCEINSNEIHKYNYLFDILNLFEKKCGNVLGMHTHDSKNIFYDKLNNENYVVFKCGNYIKYSDFDFCKIENSLKNFYSLSESCLNDFKNFNLIEDIELLRVGQDFKLIGPRLERIKILNKIVEFSDDNDMKKFLNHHCKILFNYLLNVREFFLSPLYKKYCENHKNIRFINGWLSNRTFAIENDKINLCNFYNSSINLFVKDLSSLIDKLIPYFGNEILFKFILNIIENFEGDKREHLKVLKNYIKFNNSLEKFFGESFLKFNCEKFQYFSESKLIELNNLNKKLNDLLNLISSF